MRKLVIVGASGFGREVAWMIERIKGSGKVLEVVGFCDDAPDKRVGRFGDMPLLGTVEQAAAVCGRVGFFCAIGNNRARKAVTERALACGLTPVSLVDPSAVVAPEVRMGDGCYVGIGSIVSSGAVIGAGVLVNHHVCVGHDASLGDFAQLCPGVSISGGCVLAEGVLMGSNACTIPGVRVGAWATVGAGAAALRDVVDGGSLIRIGK